MVDYTNGTQANATGATTRKFTCVNKMPVRGAKMGDTVEKARAKVVAQLLANTWKKCLKLKSGLATLLYVKARKSAWKRWMWPLSV